MRPAFSIIFFTVMSGFGFGLAALVSLGLIEMADLVTDMSLVKHPFRSGIKAQIGVEF